MKDKGTQVDGELGLPTMLAQNPEMLWIFCLDVPR